MGASVFACQCAAMLAWSVLSASSCSNKAALLTSAPNWPNACPTASINASQALLSAKSAWKVSGCTLGLRVAQAAAVDSAACCRAPVVNGHAPTALRQVTRNGLAQSCASTRYQCGAGHACGVKGRQGWRGGGGGHGRAYQRQWALRTTAAASLYLCNPQVYRLRPSRW